MSEMQGGRTVDIGVTVSRNAITVYVDGRRVRNATESPSTGAASPSLYIDGKSAPLHILSLRHYATS